MLSLEELMSIEVTGVAGVEQQVLRTPAAIHMITGEDLRRSGHRSLAEALRLSPGVFVGRSGSHRWAISPRGFNGVFANKTLVLMDGRRVYDPLQGGTYWDVQDTLLEDVDRIEVIRGPGATLWGANAVNGVINIVTKSSKETQGLFIEAGAGTRQRGFGSFRYGGRFADNAHFSVWGKYFNRGPLEAPGPGDANDEWDLGHGRFRTDIGGEGDDDLKLTLELDSYSSFTHREQLALPVPAALPATVLESFENRVRGGHALARLERFSSANQGWSILTYYDRTERRQRGFEVNRDSFELDARYHFTLGEAHALVAGVEHYYTADRARSTAVLGIDPDSISQNTVSAFIQDTITLREDRWFAMLGSKVEHHEDTGFEFQPSARLWHTPDDHDLPADLPPVRLSGHLLTQVVLNLVQNAAQAMTPEDGPPTPGGAISVWGRAVDGAGAEVGVGGEAGKAGGDGPRFVRLGVTDNGPGMTDEVRRRCLEPYFTTRTRRISSGLGLALVRGIVEKVGGGGALGIESRPGAGSTFTITLPADEPPRRPKVRAVVTIGEPRKRAVVSHLLTSLNCRVEPRPAADGPVEPPASEEGLWVTDSLGAVPGSWRGRVVVLGEPPFPPPAATSAAAASRAPPGVGVPRR